MYVLTSSATFVGAAADIGFVLGNLGPDMYLLVAPVYVLTEVPGLGDRRMTNRAGRPLRKRRFWRPSHFRPHFGPFHRSSSSNCML